MNSSRKKILWITPDYFFDVDSPVVKMLNEKYDLSWIVILSYKESRFSEDEVQEFCERHNVETKIVRPKGRRRSIHQFLFSLKLIRDIKAFQPDVVYTSYFHDPFLLPLSLLFLKTRNLIYALHDVKSHSNFSTFIDDALKKLALKHLSNFHVFSKSQGEILRELTKGKKIHIIPLAVKDYGHARRERGTIDKPKKFLFFGNIESYKGLDILIEAFEDVLNSGYGDAILTIAGKGRHWEACEKLIKTPSQYYLRIGFIPNDQIADYFTTHDFLILPYKDVTQSGPLMVAYNYNLPVVASKLDGFTEWVIDEYTGYLAEASEVKELRNALEKCLRLTGDEYAGMKKDLGVFVSEHCAIETIRDKYIAMFESIPGKTLAQNAIIRSSLKKHEFLSRSKETHNKSVNKVVE